MAYGKRWKLPDISKRMTGLLFRVFELANRDTTLLGRRSPKRSVALSDMAGVALFLIALAPHLSAIYRDSLNAAGSIANQALEAVAVWRCGLGIGGSLASRP